jgi:peptidoglycan/LPS O-acetylase OafA/YrhL
MSNAKGYGIQQLLLLAVIAASALSVAISSSRQKSSQTAISVLPLNLPKPAAKVPSSRRKIRKTIFLSIAAVLILAVDAVLVWKAGDIVANAYGATFVAVGATLLLLAGTKAMV